MKADGTAAGGVDARHGGRNGGAERRRLSAPDLLAAGLAALVLVLSGGKPQAIGAATCVLAALDLSLAVRRAYGTGSFPDAPAAALRGLLVTALIAWACSFCTRNLGGPAHLGELGAITLWGWLLALGMLGRAALAGPARERAAASIERRRPVGLEAPPRVSVVIPALDEAENLRHVLPRLPEGLHEVILVDGRSTDDTIRVALEERPSIRIITQPGSGKGDACRTGFEAATGDIIVMLDADGSADPAEIWRFVEPLRRGADFAKGSRYIDGGGSADMTRIRQLGNWALNRAVNLLYGTAYTDLCYGYNAFWVQCLPCLSPDAPGFEVETLLNVRAAKAGLKIAEVPSFEAERIHGESHLNPIRDGLRVLRTIIWELPVFSSRPADGRAPWGGQEPAPELLASGR